MERVKKGETYWYIASDFFAGNFYVTYGVDFYEDIQDGRFTLGNYFHTKEEAEAMAEKIRRVLKGAWVIDPPEGEILSRKVEAILNGAEVIEMPSEEEINKRKDFWDRTPTDARTGFGDCLRWLKSKIVK